MDSTKRVTELITDEICPFQVIRTQFTITRTENIVEGVFDVPYRFTANLSVHNHYNRVHNHFQLTRVWDEYLLSLLPSISISRCCITTEFSYFCVSTDARLTMDIYWAISASLFSLTEDHAGGAIPASMDPKVTLKVQL